jgi:hypothetical protein
VRSFIAAAAHRYRADRHLADGGVNRGSSSHRRAHCRPRADRRADGAPAADISADGSTTANRRADGSSNR